MSYEVARAVGGTVSAVGGTVGDAVGDVLETGLVRGAAAWDAVAGHRVGPPVAVRRWPWAVLAAVLGAAAGAAAALLIGRLLGSDAPDAQEPEDVEAVVDRPLDPPSGQPAAG
jgi:hypothetical protein